MITPNLLAAPIAAYLVRLLAPRILAIAAGGLIIFTLASIARGLSSEVWMLILARAIQGAGGAAIMPLSLTLLSTSVPEQMRPPG